MMSPKKIELFTNGGGLEEIDVEELARCGINYFKVSMADEMITETGLVWYTWEGEYTEIKKKKQLLHILVKNTQLAWGKQNVYFRHPNLSGKTFVVPKPNARDSRVLRDNKLAAEIIEIFDSIALPFMEGRFEPKKEAMLSLLGDDAVFKEGVGVVIPAKGKRTQTLMAHMDLIPSFNKGFLQGRTLSVLSDGTLVGALDNTITNAVAIWLYKNAKLPDNCEVVFTVGEETSGHGAKNYCESLGKDEKISIINLDVTNEFPKKSVSIEYDQPSVDGVFDIHKFIIKNNNFSIGLTEDRVGDDLCTVHSCGYNGVSFCIPTLRTIHSYKSATTVKQLEEYCLSLESFLKAQVKIGGDRDIFYLDIEKIKNWKSSKKVLKAEEKASENIQNSFWGNRGRSLFSFDYDGDDYYDAVGVPNPAVLSSSSFPDYEEDDGFVSKLQSVSLLNPEIGEVAEVIYDLYLQLGNELWEYEAFAEYLYVEYSNRNNKEDLNIEFILDVLISEGLVETMDYVLFSFLDDG